MLRIKAKQFSTKVENKEQMKQQVSKEILKFKSQVKSIERRHMINLGFSSEHIKRILQSDGSNESH